MLYQRYPFKILVIARMILFFYTLLIVANVYYNKERGVRIFLIVEEGINKSPHKRREK